MCSARPDFSGDPANPGVVGGLPECTALIASSKCSHMFREASARAHSVEMALVGWSGRFIRIAHSSSSAPQLMWSQAYLGEYSMSLLVYALQGIIRLFACCSGLGLVNNFANLYSGVSLVSGVC